MTKTVRKSKQKEIRPAFYVFCEGETEEAYISFLKKKYRIPIEIITNISGNCISKKMIDNYVNKKTRHEKDKIFLMYDLDIPEVSKKLFSIENENTILLGTNPCFELWYILHWKNQNAFISSVECIEKLKKFCPNYEKGKINNKLREKLNDSKNAKERALKMKNYQNPSTTVYVFIEELEKNKLKN